MKKKPKTKPVNSSHDQRHNVYNSSRISTYVRNVMQHQLWKNGS